MPLKYILPVVLFAILIGDSHEMFNVNTIKTKPRTEVHLAAISYSVANNLCSNATYDDDYEDLFVVIADTGKNYFALREKMMRLGRQMHYPIDTMNRYYNAEKNEIVLSETDEDEMYRGAYFPRRFPSENLSLEYYHAYNGKSTAKNIAIVSAIYASRKKADSALAVLRKFSNKAFRIRSHIYTGCMH